MDSEKISLAILRCHQQLRRLKDNTGRNITEQFKKLPLREEDPGYYEIIQRPVSFLMIRNRIDKQKYTSITQWISDVELLISNYRMLHRHNTGIIKDLDIMQSFLNVYVKSRIYHFDNGNTQPNTRVISSPSAPGGRDHERMVENLRTLRVSDEEFSIDDSILIRNEIDQRTPLIGHIHRIVKTNSVVCFVVSIYLRKEYIERKIFQENEMELGDKEIFISTIVRIVLSNEIITKCYVNERDGFECMRFYDMKTKQLSSFCFDKRRGFLVCLSEAIGKDSKLFCHYLVPKRCHHVFFDTLDDLIRHSYDHILSPDLSYLSYLSMERPESSPGSSCSQETHGSTTNTNKFLMSPIQQGVASPMLTNSNRDNMEISWASQNPRYHEYGIQPYSRNAVPFQQDLNYPLKFDCNHTHPSSINMEHYARFDKDTLWWLFPPLNIANENSVEHTLAYHLFCNGRDNETA